MISLKWRDLLDRTVRNQSMKKTMLKLQVLYVIRDCIGKFYCTFPCTKVNKKRVVILSLQSVGPFVCLLDFNSHRIIFRNLLQRFSCLEFFRSSSASLFD